MKTRRRKPDNNSEEVSVGHSTVLFGYAQNLHENGKKVTRLLIVVNTFHYKFILFEYMNQYPNISEVNRIIDHISYTNQWSIL